MIENNTNANPTLTFDQLQAIDTSKKILSNLESEITNAQKILKGTKMECDRAVKEKVYQEELLATTTSQAEVKTKELDDLKTNLLDISYKLDDLNKELKEKTLKNNVKTAELENREIDLIKEEKELSSKEANYEADFKVLKEYKDDFDSKVAKLKEVISIF